MSHRDEAPYARAISLGTILPLLYVAGLLIALIVPAHSDVTRSDWPLRFLLLLSALATACHLLNLKDRNWLRLDTVFLVGFFIVYFQGPVMIDIAGILPERPLTLDLSRQHLAEGTQLATIGLISWLLGYSLGPRSATHRPDSIAGTTPALIVFMLLLAAFALLAGGSYFSGLIYREAVYGLTGSISGTAAYLLEVLSLTAVVIVAATFYQAQTLGHRPKSFAIVTALITAYMVVFLIAGERGALLQLATVIGVIYCTKFRPLALWEFIALVIAGAFLFSMLGVIRTGQTDNVLGFWRDGGWFGLTQNLSNSLVALHLGMDAVERNGTYFWGQLWASNILSVVPFAQSYFIAATDMAAWQLNSAYYIQYMRYGPMAHTSDGTTVIGDIYMNFGQPGLVAAMLAHGIVSRIFATRLKENSGFLSFIAAALFLSLIFYVSRGSYFVQLRPVLWGTLITLLIFRWRRLV